MSFFYFKANGGKDQLGLVTASLRCYALLFMFID